MKFKLNKQGFTIVEVFVVIAVIVVAFTAILGFFTFKAKVAERARMKLKAISLAEQGMEAVRNFRDNTYWNSEGIGSLVANTDYHPASSSSGWNIVSGKETVNDFTRAIVFDNVSRDSNDNIQDVYQASNNDSQTRKVTILISWSDRQGLATESLTGYITNWRK